MGIRTPGLFIANEALYQLSYTPECLTENKQTPVITVRAVGRSWKLRNWLRG